MEITTADTPAQLGAVHRLTYDAYVAVGLCPINSRRRLQHYPYLDEIPETTVVIATAGDELVGSVSITVDGPMGLHVDEDFPNIMSRMRTPGSRMAAAWRIVTDPAYCSDRRLIVPLMRAGFAAAIARQVELLVCSFHPKRERFHKRLGFFTVARGECRALGGAKAVLMAYPVGQNGIPKRLRRGEK